MRHYAQFAETLITSLRSFKADDELFLLFMLLNVRGLSNKILLKVKFNITVDIFILFSFYNGIC